MATHLGVGLLAAKLGVNYARLHRRVKRGPALPGQIMVGKEKAYDLSKLEEIREVLKADGVIEEEAAAVA